MPGGKRTKCEGGSEKEREGEREGGREGGEEAPTLDGASEEGWGRRREGEGEGVGEGEGEELRVQRHVVRVVLLHLPGREGGREGGREEGGRRRRTLEVENLPAHATSGRVVRRLPSPTPSPPTCRTLSHSSASATVRRREGGHMFEKKMWYSANAGLASSRARRAAFSSGRREGGK